MQAAGVLEKADIFIDDTAGLNMFELRTKARRLQAKHPLSLVIVDYLQLMAGDGRADNRQQEVSNISRSMKQLARELAVPVIAVSQLNRSPEARADKEPQLSDLRESGAIEQDADMVMFIYEDPNDPAAKGVVKVKIAKHRNGPTGLIRLGFVRDYTQFRTLRQTDDYGYGDDSRRGPAGRDPPPAARPRTSPVRRPSLDPVALMRALGLEGEAPVVLLDSAGGSAAAGPPALPRLGPRLPAARAPRRRERHRRAPASAARAGRRPAPSPSAPAPSARWRRSRRCAPRRGWRRSAARSRSGRDLPEAEALFGLLAYDAVRYLERLPDTTRDDLGLPDIDVFLPGRLLRYDIAAGEALLVDRLAADDGAAAAEAARVGAALARARHRLPRRAARQRPARVPQQLHAGGVRGGRAPAPASTSSPATSSRPTSRSASTSATRCRACTSTTRCAP